MSQNFYKYLEPVYIVVFFFCIGTDQDLICIMGWKSSKAWQFYLVVNSFM